MILNTLFKPKGEDIFCVFFIKMDDNNINRYNNKNNNNNNNNNNNHHRVFGELRVACSVRERESYLLERELKLCRVQQQLEEHLGFVLGVAQHLLLDLPQTLVVHVVRCGENTTR